MAISYPVTIPATPDFQQVDFRLLSNTTVFQSPLTKTIQVLERPGRLWHGSFALPPMGDPEAAIWTGFFASLRGRRGTFNSYDPARTTPRGSAPGTPLVDGASQTGYALATKGWTAGQTNILRVGDYIGVNSRFHMIVEDASSDGSGLATLSIEPELRESPSDSAAIATAAPKCVMRLAEDDVGWSVSEGGIYGFQFTAMEVL